MHPVPQLTLQSFFDWQLNVAPFGGGVVPASPAEEPSVQVPPEAQLHVAPLHEQAPVQSGELLEDAPEHAVTTRATVAGNAM